MTYNVNADFCFPEIKADTEFVDGERQTYEFTPFIWPAEWMDQYYMLTLGQGYSTPVPIKLKPWQIEPVNAMAIYQEIMLAWSTQIGKSTCAEGMYYWQQDYEPMNAMLCYAKKETIESVFDERIREQILCNSRMRRLWDGNPDNLTKKRCKLRTFVMRVASAHVRDDIASFTAPLIVASECSKYNELDYDVMLLLRGRQSAGVERGKFKSIFESSPLEVGDPLHAAMFRPGVLNLEPYHPCPYCGEYQVLVLEQVKERPNAAGEHDHNPDRIRNESAAYYECVYCQKPMTDEHRKDFAARVKWAAKTEKIGLNGDLLCQRKEYRAVSFQAGRLVEYSYTLPECLARFFEALRSSKPVKLKDLLNEDHARFADNKTAKRDSHYLMSKCATYKISDACIPDGVLTAILCVDTQDSGFWFVLRGLGLGMESWLLDIDFISCDMNKDADPSAILARVNERLGRKQLLTQDGTTIDIAMELWDRGGHKAKFVDYIVSRRTNAYAYIGSTEKNSPFIRQNPKSGLYIGNKRDMSKAAAKMAERDDWHLPEDVPTDYLNQFVAQYEVEQPDRYGNNIKKWIEGSNDHCRDCENMIQACISVLDLQETLCNAEAVENLRNEIISGDAPKERVAPQENYFSDIQKRWGR